VDRKNVRADDYSYGSKKLIREKGILRPHHLPDRFYNKKYSRQESKPVYSDLSKSRIKDPAAYNKGQYKSYSNYYYVSPYFIHVLEFTMNSVRMQISLVQSSRGCIIVSY
jgi:hypothetical protein